jgi:hypothetical protein
MGSTGPQTLRVIAALTFFSAAVALMTIGVLAPNSPPKVDESATPILLVEFGTPEPPAESAWFDVQRSILLHGESVLIEFEPQVELAYVAFAAIRSPLKDTRWDCYVQFEIVESLGDAPDSADLRLPGSESDVSEVLRLYKLNVEPGAVVDVSAVSRFSIPKPWVSHVASLACYLDRPTSTSLSQSREVIYPARIFAATPFEVSPSWRWVNETARVIVPSSWTRVGNSHDIFGENSPRTGDLRYSPALLTVELEHPLVFVNAERAQGDAVWLAFWLTVVGAMLGIGTALLVGVKERPSNLLAPSDPVHPEPTQPDRRRLLGVFFAGLLAGAVATRRAARRR